MNVILLGNMVFVYLVNIFQITGKPLTHYDLNYVIKYGVRAFMWMKKYNHDHSHLIDNMWMRG